MPRTTLFLGISFQGNLRRSNGNGSVRFINLAQLQVDVGFFADDFKPGHLSRSGQRLILKEGALLAQMLLPRRAVLHLRSPEPKRYRR